MMEKTMSDELLLLQTSLADKDEAETMAAALVEARFAACVQIAGPVRSVYRWQGQVEHQHEFVLSAKIRRTRYDEVATWLKDHHSYSLPEIIAVPICQVESAYLNWALGETQ